jgi:hypothetical protein
MKKTVLLVLAGLVMTGIAMAGGGRQSAGSDGPFPGKIAIISSDLSQNEEEFRSAENLQRK